MPISPAEQEELNRQLIVACEDDNNLDLVQSLLDRGAAIDCQPRINNWPMTPLMTAAEKGQIKITRLLLDRGADVNHINPDRNTALIFASEHPEITRLLLDRGAEVNCENELGCTALFYAAETGNIECARLLIDRGADVNHVNQKGETALVCIAENEFDRLNWDNQIAVTDFLINNGAIVDLQRAMGYTALKKAAWVGYARLVNFLIDKGAEVNAQSQDGNTPLHIAASRDENADVVDVLIKRGADVNHANHEGNTALMRASEHADIETVLLLINKGASVLKQNQEGHDALWFANQPDDHDTWQRERRAQITHLLETHKERLGQLAEYIERAEINKEPSNLTQEQKDLFLKDAHRLNEYDIAIALTERLVNKEINIKIANGELANNDKIIKSKKTELHPKYLERATKIVRSTREKYFVNKSRGKVDITLKKKYLPQDAVDKVVSYLTNEDIPNLLTGTSKRSNYPEAILRAKTIRNMTMEDINAQLPPPPPAGELVARAGGEPLTAHDLALQARAIAAKAQEDNRKRPASPSSPEATSSNAKKPRHDGHGI